jgi:hypothetical protein
MHSLKGHSARILATAAGSTLAVVLTIQASAQQAKLPEGKGKAEVERTCSDCHELAVITSEHHSKSQWKQIVDDMVSRGASGTADELSVIVDYLTANFGPPSPSNSK